MTSRSHPSVQYQGLLGQTVLVIGGGAGIGLETAPLAQRQRD